MSGTLRQRDQHERYRLAGGISRAEPLDGERSGGPAGDGWYRCRIPRAALKQLMRRSDAAGLANFGPWIVLLAGSGWLAWLSWGSWWAVPAFLLYGTLYTSSDAHWHECAHGTAFRSRWLNEAFYQLTSFMCLREAHLWRWSHARHHTETMIAGRDPEITVPRPANLPGILADFLYLNSGFIELRKIVGHAFGRVSPAVREFVPEAERPKMIRVSRIYVAVVAVTTAGSAALGSPLPLLFVFLPRFYGAWFHQLCVLTQHAGLAEDQRDHRLSTRTVAMNPVARFLYVNMNYHLEHHMFPTVPFHALPRLHEAVKDQMPPPYDGFLGAYREILPTLIRQARDPGYFVRRPLPAAA
ncbi:MAG: fatty acid desaturase family protein [Dongiaceae bacterium]